jgi:hypothetical protein
VLVNQPPPKNTLISARGCHQKQDVCPTYIVPPKNHKPEIGDCVNLRLVTLYYFQLLEVTTYHFSSTYPIYHYSQDGSKANLTGRWDEGVTF